MTTISIVIATFNRANDLHLTLESLLRLRAGATFDYEVLVMDNNSTDNTRQVVESMTSRFHGRLSYGFEPRQGKSHALNAGIQKSKGQIVAFTDDDVLVDPDWLVRLMDCFEQFSCDGVGGRVLPSYPQDTAPWIKNNAVQMAGAVVIYDYGDKTEPLNAGMYPFIGANYAFQRTVFDECGLFRLDLGPGTQTMGEDTEIARRFLNAGKKLYYCGSALIVHPFDSSRLDLRHLARWHEAVGRFDAQNEKKSQERFVYWARAPRYLWKGLVIDGIKILALSLAPRRLPFYNAWRSLFRKIGMIKEYRAA